MKGNNINKVEVKCDACGKTLLRHPCRLKHKHQFCDMKCLGEYNKTHGNFKKGHKINKGRVPWNKGKSNKVKKKCFNCGKEIMVKNHKKDNKRFFCSISCRGEYAKKNPELYYPKRKIIKCKECGKSFEVSNKSKQEFCGNECKNSWFSKQPEYLEKLRNSRIEYMEEQYFNGEPVTPAVGKYETSVLDILEEFWNCKIKRQHLVAGYFLDGYCPQFNVAIEVDESYHNKQKEKDKMREDVIKDRIGCNFLRIGVPSI